MGKEIRVGWKSVAVNERDLKMRNPRPSYAQVGNYDYQGSWSNGRLEPRMRGFKHQKFLYLTP